MYKIGYKVTIGSYSFDSENANYLLSMDSKASMNIPVNSCNLIFYNSGDISISIGDDVKVQLGYKGNLNTIFTGKVYSSEIGIRQIHVEALSSFSALTKSNINCLYEQQVSSGIVGDILGQFGISTGMLEPGLSFPSYAVSDTSTTYKNIKILADKNGFDFYADSDDKACFQTFIPGSPIMITYGANIINFDLNQVTESIDGVEVYGESPVGQGQGSETSSWFTKKDVKGSAGQSSGNVVRISEPTARDKSLVQSIALNLMSSKKAIKKAKVKLLGQSDIGLGKCILVSGMPTSDLNGLYKVTSVDNFLSSTKGYVSDVMMEMIS